MVYFAPGATNTQYKDPTKQQFVPTAPKQSFVDQFGFKKKPGSFTSDLYNQSQQAGFDPSAANLVNAAGKQVATIAGDGLKFIPPGKRKSEFATNAGKVSGDIAMHGTDEAQDFKFNLPESGFNRAQSGLFDLSNQLIGGMGGGQMDRETAQQELSKLQRMALSPVEGMSAAERQQYQDMADQRRAELEQRFNPGGDISNLFARQGASDVASLANRGVLDSTTGAQSMARRDTDLAAMYQQLLGGANEQSRQDLIGAQGRLADTATQFGGLQGGQATASGQLGQGYGQLGLQGLGAAGDLGLRNQEQQGQFQLAETGQRLLGNQLQLQNIQSLLNSRLNRKLTKEQAAMQQQLFDKYMNPEFNWLGAAGGLFQGTGIGNFIQGGMG